MKRKYLVSVGISEYEHGIKPVCYTASDALAMAILCSTAGFEVHEFINKTATYENLNQELTKIGTALEPNDELWFFYAGHGCVDAYNRTLLTCYDTVLVGKDIERGIRLGDVTGMFLQQQPDANLVLFIDSCHSTLVPDLPFYYSRSEVLDAAKSHNVLCFASCLNNEISQGSDAAKHGFWTYRLLEGLRGNVAQILSKGRFLDPYFLQGYLRQEVASDISRESGEQQHPTLYGTFGKAEYLLDVADLESFAKRNLYVHWRLPRYTSEFPSNELAVSFVESSALALVEQFRKVLGAIEKWNEPGDKRRDIRWIKDASIITVQVTWNYEGSDNTVAADIIIETETVEDLSPILDAELAPYFSYRITFLDGGAFANLSGDNKIRIGSEKGNILIEIHTTAEGRSIWIQTENLDPMHPGMYNAHRELPMCVLRCLHEKTFSGQEIHALADRCINTAKVVVAQ